MKKILIADDEPNIVISLEFLMEQSGYSVRTVDNGEDALKEIGDFLPDLVLLDVMLPKKNGYDVCQAIRNDPSTSTVKVIMLSAKGRDVEITKGLAAGANAYITKPFSTTDLVAQVARMLSE